MNQYNQLIAGVKKAAFNFPDQIAIASAKQNISYETLLERAQSMACLILQNLGQSKLNRIVIFAEREMSVYISVLASLLTGAAFIPVNPKTSLERNAKIINQCQPEAMIILEKNSDVLAELSSLVTLPPAFTLGDQGEIQLFSAEISKPNSTRIETIELPEISEDDFAYILFTSGSTGQPKGVPITHKNVCSFLQYMQSRYHITSNDKLSQTFELTFDLAIFDLFMSWCHGATLCLMQVIDLIAPNNYIQKNGITVWFSVPTVISLMTKQGLLNKNDFPSLRLSLFCGEPILVSMMSQWSEAANHSICENLYGPTELTIACAHYQYQRESNNAEYNQVLSIGKIFPHLEYRIIDASGNAVTEQEAGELCVYGSQCFSGYLNNDTANQHAFVQVIEDQTSKRFYRTGDFVRETDQGDLLYLGRHDQQIKINGFRVELGEVESILNQLNNVERSFVFAFRNEEAQEIAAFIVGEVTVDEVVGYAKQQLPYYMVPRHVIVGKEMPLNVNGKIDRQKILSQINLK